MPAFHVVPEVSMFFVQDGKVLLLRRANTGYEDGKYCLPAGHVEEGETVVESAIREAMEEVGVRIKPEHLEFAHIMYRKHNDQRVSFYFFVQEWQGEPQNMEPHKHDDMQWFPLDQVPELMGFHTHAFEEILKKKGIFSEIGFAVTT